MKHILFTCFFLAFNYITVITSIFVLDQYHKHLENNGSNRCNLIREVISKSTITCAINDKCMLTYCTLVPFV